MNWEFTPRKNGIQVTVLTHYDVLLGVQLRSNSLGFTISLFHISFYVNWFNRAEYEQDLKLLLLSETEEIEIDEEEELADRRHNACDDMI